MRMRWMQILAVVVAGAARAPSPDAVADAPDREIELEGDERQRESADWRPDALRTRRGRQRNSLRRAERPVRRSPCSCSACG